MWVPRSSCSFWRYKRKLSGSSQVLQIMVLVPWIMKCTGYTLKQCSRSGTTSLKQTKPSTELNLAECKITLRHLMKYLLPRILTLIMESQLENNQMQNGSTNNCNCGQRKNGWGNQGRGRSGCQNMGSWQMPFALSWPCLWQTDCMLILLQTQSRVATKTGSANKMEMSKFLFIVYKVLWDSRRNLFWWIVLWSHHNF